MTTSQLLEATCKLARGGSVGCGARPVRRQCRQAGGRSSSPACSFSLGIAGAAMRPGRLHVGRCITVHSGLPGLPAPPPPPRVGSGVRPATSPASGIHPSSQLRAMHMGMHLHAPNLRFSEHASMCATTTRARAVVARTLRPCRVAGLLEQAAASSPASRLHPAAHCAAPGRRDQTRRDGNF